MPSLAAQKLQKLMDSRRVRGDRTHGFAGDLEGTVEAEKPGYMFVRVPKGSGWEVGEFPGSVSAAGIPVTLERDPFTGQQVVTTGGDGGAIAYNGGGSITVDPGQYAFSAHADRHGLTGDDQLNVSTLLLSPLTITVALPRLIVVGAGAFMISGVNYFKSASSSLDLSSCYPATGVKYVWVLLSSTGVLSYQDDPATTYAALVQPSSTKFIVAIAQLQAGSNLKITDILDLRFKQPILPKPTRGDLLTGQDATATWKVLAKGTQYQLLTGGVDEPTWGAVNLGQATAITGTLPVASGGTGIATTTAFSVICAGTTATGAFQSLASLGNAGEVLTSNGAAALPTWQAAGGAAHNLLSATHTDTTPATPPGLGSLITGSALGKWGELVSAGTAGSFLFQDVSGLYWSTFYLFGTGGGSTTFSITNGENLTLIAAGSYDITFPNSMSFPVDAAGYLYSDGAGTMSWVAGGVPGGNDHNVQYNNAGAFGGSDDFLYDGSGIGFGGAITAYRKFTLNNLVNGVTLNPLIGFDVVVRRTGPAATNTSNVIYGMSLDASNTASGNHTGVIVGGQFSAQQLSTSGTCTTIIGGQFKALCPYTGGIISYAIGGQFGVETQQSGLITVGYGVKVLSPVNPNNIDAYYGVYIEAATALTTAYAIYSAGGQSYFAGNIDIISTTALQLKVGYDVGSYFTADVADTTGIATFNTTGSTPGFVFTPAVTFSSTINGNILTTGTGTLTLSTFTLTVPATGTVALLGTANVFTATQSVTIGSTTATTTPLTVSATFTAAAGTIYGIYSNMTAAPTEASTQSVYAAYTIASATSAYNMTNLIGYVGGANNNSTATVGGQYGVYAFCRAAGTSGTATTTTVIGINVEISKTGAGGTWVIGTAYGVRILAPTAASGTLTGTTLCGLYLQDFSNPGGTWTTKWSIYSVGGNNAFGGNTRIGGVTAPVYTCDVTGDIKCTTGFGCNAANPQTAYASGGAVAPGAGAYGASSAANFAALATLVTNIRLALVADGIMS